jgi:hypothetical protein
MATRSDAVSIALTGSAVKVRVMERRHAAKGLMAGFTLEQALA